MCPTTQCTTCWYPKAQSSDPDAVFPFRNTEEAREKVAEERRRLLDRDGTPRDRCKVEICHIKGPDIMPPVKGKNNDIVEDIGVPFLYISAQLIFVNTSKA